MEDIKKAIIRLLGVRTIITLSLTATLIYGFVVGRVETKDFLMYLAMAFAFFFSKENKSIQEATQETIQETQKPSQYKGGLG